MISEKVLSKIFPALGTVNTVTLYGDSDQCILELVKKRVLQLHQLFSVFDPDSDVSKINRQAGISPVSICEDTYALLSLAQRLAEETAGVYDITAGAVSMLWRNAIRSNRIPSESEINECRALTNIRNLKLCTKNHTAFLHKKGQQIDLGGIAKGYAADEARRILRDHGIEHAMLNLGGTVIPLGSTHYIGIQNPFERTGVPAASINIKDKAVVTSGYYGQFFIASGECYHHIIDPRTGRPSRTGLTSVTLIGNSAAELDALATAVYILGIEKGYPILCKRGIEAVFITDSGSVQITPGLQRQFSMAV